MSRVLDGSALPKRVGEQGTVGEETDLASRRLLAVTEEELSRIVLDIHDGPVQYLFAALSLLTRLQHQIEAQPAGNRDILPSLTRVTDLVEEALHEIKSFLGTFRPPEFHKRPLMAIVQGLVIQHEEWTGDSVSLSIENLDAAPNDIVLPVKIALYRIVQEALSNAHRHGGTSEQWVRLWMENDYVCLQVRDNGKGFEPPPLEGPQATEREEHIGLRGMRDRVKLLGGVFILNSSPGKGTSITVKIPPYIKTVKEGSDVWSGFE